MEGKKDLIKNLISNLLSLMITSKIFKKINQNGYFYRLPLIGKQTKLVLAWAELHKEELLANWELIINGDEPFKIQPLR